MNTYDSIIKSMPSVAFRLNPLGTEYVDLTGGGTTLSSTPSIDIHGIVSGSTKSALISSGTPHNLYSSLFIRSQERRAFTLEATILPMDSTTDFVSVLSHNGVEDGLYIKNNSINFTVEFATQAPISVSYEIGSSLERINVQAVWTPAKVQLFVNGLISDEKEVSIEQILDGFKSRASSNLYIGQGAANGKKYGIDGVAIYSRAISDAECYIHYVSSVPAITHNSVTQIFGAGMVLDGENSRNIFDHVDWSNDWTRNTVLSSVVVSESNSIVPEINYTTKISEPGEFVGSINVDGIDTVYGIVVKWHGSGLYSVYTSIDGGTTWTAATNGQTIAGTFNVSTTAMKPAVRVVFNGGITNDSSEVSEISMTAYADEVIYTTDSNRPGAATATTITKDIPYNNGQRSKSDSLRISGQTTIISDPSPTDFSTVATLEFWVMFESSSAGQYIYDARPDATDSYIWTTTGNFYWAVGTVYINGQPVSSGSQSIVANKWMHVVHVLPAPVNPDVIIGPRAGTDYVNYGHIAFYEYSMTAPQAKTIYDSYTKVTTSMTATESNPVTEAAPAYKTYDNDWSLTPSLT